MRSKRREPRDAAKQNCLRVQAETSVLIIDDDHDVGSSVAELLTMEGYAARHCSTAEAALVQVAAGLDPALVILDLWIPAMGSSALMARLGALLPSTPVLLLSGSARDLQFTRLEAAAMLVKPVEGSTLVRIVDKLARSRATSARRGAKRIARRPKGRCHGELDW